MPSRLLVAVGAAAESPEQVPRASAPSQLEEMGHDAKGAVGADDPMLAFADAIGEFKPDHILIAIRGHGEADWQEHGLVEQILERFRLPVTVFAA